METRNSEVKELQKYYEDRPNALVLLYGSSRSGKDDLMRKFLADKNFFYFRCRNASVEKQLSLLITEVQKNYDIKISKQTFEECFTRIKSRDGKKLVVVIDEFQLAGKRQKELFDALIRLLDGKLYPGPVMIVIGVSSLAWMKRDMDDVFGDKIRKLSAQIPVQDKSFLDLVRKFPRYSVMEAVKTYGVLGGVPEYLRRWDGNLSFQENICLNVLARDGFFRNEAENFISGELRELAVYDTILASMASGKEKLNDLYLDTGYSRAKISVYLKNLAAFDVVEKVVSFDTGGWDNAKKGIYRFKNHYVNFWFHFIYPNLSELSLLDPDEFYERHIEPGLSNYLKRYFVDVCHEYLVLLNRMGRLPVKMVKQGTWIGKEGTIDIIGQDSIRENVVGICNWDEKVMSYEKYEALLSNMTLAKLRAKVIYLFSATDFDNRLKSLADSNPGIVLVDMTEL